MNAKTAIKTRQNEVQHVSFTAHSILSLSLRYFDSCVVKGYLFYASELQVGKLIEGEATKRRSWTLFFDKLWSDYSTVIQRPIEESQKHTLDCFDD